MATEARRTKKILLKELNTELTCSLCHGYFIDATTLVDCVHIFCRGCILKHFESAKLSCPTCNKKKITFRPDPQTQALVYKMVPGLYSKEMLRREDFYRSTGVRANSSCSDDSILGDLKQDQEKWMSTNVDYNTQFYSPDDSISLSLEYYQYHLDETSTETSTKQASPNEQKLIKCDPDIDERVRDRRYLSCPAAVSMSLLQKFLRMKYALSPEHKVDIIYEGEVLPAHFNLMDVAYTFNWTKVKPMRFFYRIFTPMKIQPIKIINTQTSTGGKQLQIVPVKPTSEPKPASEEEPFKSETDSQSIRNKERLMAHLKLQSRHKPVAVVAKTAEDGTKKKKKSPEPHCVYEYEEPDKEEIKRFAENRDREWARMRYEDQQPSQHVSKKRKKSKHSKSDVAHKKRKIHAEITSQESIKLKVKLTPHNGHKHKHHRTSQIVESTPVDGSSSSKEKLTQMRAVRHKSNSSDDKPVVEEPIKPREEKIVETPKPSPVVTVKEIVPKKPDEPQTSGSKVLRSDFATKSSTKEVKKTESEKQAQKTFLKTFQSNAEGTGKVAEKIQQNKVEKAVERKPINTYSNPNHVNQVKSLERKIATLQQQCTIETKPLKMELKNDKRVSFASDKPHILNSQYGTGFTVSKVEAGVKRKVESEESSQDKRPSLEITLINPPAEVKPAVKRPPPATIPLKRIKTSLNLKSGVSIIPKALDRCDNIGALDLTKPSKLEPGKTNGITLNGIKDLKTINTFTKLMDKNTQLSNLQMLSKVASEHPTINKPPHQSANAAGKLRPQLPSLQNIKIPTPPKQPPNLTKMPKLTEINKSNFRVLNNTQIRNMRPSQNQSVRSIPNPSLLVRQQNQNRMNLSNGPAPVQNGESKEPKILNTMAKDNVKDEKKSEAGISVK